MNCLPYLLAALLAAVPQAACTSVPVAPVEPAQVALHFGFLRTGATTREEVLERLGQPSAEFDRDRMLTYRFYKNRLGKLVPPAQASDSPGASEYTLVLSFDDRGLLSRHALVLTK